MKFFAVLFLCAGIISGLFAAGGTQIAIVNTGKNAVLKIKDRGDLKISEKTYRDRKTGAQTFRCVFFSLPGKSGKDHKINLTLEAANGDMTIYIGNQKLDYFTWSSFKVDGKDMVDKKSATFNTTQLKIGKIDKLKEIRIEGSCRLASRKEANAAEKSRKAAKNSKKRTKKSK